MKTKDCAYKGFFGGKRTPKAITVGLCVHPEDRIRPLEVGGMVCRTYRGVITKTEKCRVLQALTDCGANTAYGWTPNRGHFVVAATDDSPIN